MARTIQVVPKNPDVYTKTNQSGRQNETPGKRWNQHTKLSHLLRCRAERKQLDYVLDILLGADLLELNRELLATLCILSWRKCRHFCAPDYEERG